MVAILALAVSWAPAAISDPTDDIKVKITRGLPYVEVLHKGQNVRIQRIQDTDNHLIDDFAKTSRPCPPFCIHPMSAAPGVETVGELELIAFLKDDVASGKGILIDARMPKWHAAETIPGAINIPFVVFHENNPYMEKILAAMGAVRNSDGEWDYAEAKSLILFCNGPWCDQSPRAIKGLLSLGYPAEKIRYYRGGMNLWRLFGLTTVVSKKPISQ